MMCYAKQVAYLNRLESRHAQESRCRCDRASRGCSCVLATRGAGRDLASAQPQSLYPRHAEAGDDAGLLPRCVRIRCAATAREFESGGRAVEQQAWDWLKGILAEVPRREFRHRDDGVL